MFAYTVRARIIIFFWTSLIIFWRENNEIDRCAYLHVLLRALK